jgi:anti-sigma factor RsiW
MTGFDIPGLGPVGPFRPFDHFGHGSAAAGGRHLGDLLSALLDGELSRSAEGAAHAHLATCPSCRAELEDVRMAQTWVRRLPPAEPPFGFLERLAIEPPDESRRPSPRWVSVAAVAASAAAAVGLLGLAPPREAPVSPRVDRMVEAHATGASLSSDPLSRLAPIGVPITFRR